MKVITSTDIHADVVRLVENAQHFLLLISPYVDPWDRLTTEVKAASLREGLRVMLLVRGGEDATKQAEKARSLMFPKVQVEHLNRLHAKIYMSESEIIVTSMNLLKSSALDSWEIALRFNKIEDARQYDEISAQALMLWKRALDERAGEEKLRLSAGAEAGGWPAHQPLPGTSGWAPATKQGTAKTPPGAGKPSTSTPRAGSTPAPAKPGVNAAPEQFMDKIGRLAATLASVTAPTKAAAPPPRPGAATVGRAAAPTAGTCIRCGVRVPKNPEKPLCPSCYKAWAKYENPLYEESFCHDCGKAATTSLARPLCRPCYARS